MITRKRSRSEWSLRRLRRNSRREQKDDKEWEDEETGSDWGFKGTRKRRRRKS